jgi:RNA polymerase sigma-70 factor (ECF subfamily)
MLHILNDYKGLQGCDTECSLVKRCLEGDNSAWEVIINRFSRRIFNLSYRFTGRKEEAEDLTQEIFIRIYQNLGSFRSDSGSLQHWILRVARNLVIDFYRQQKPFQNAIGSEEMETMNLQDHKTPTPFRRAQQAEASKFLKDGLSTLDPELKDAIVLRYVRGLAYREIASILAVPEGTIKSRISRGRNQLARRLIRNAACELVPA